MLTMLLVSLIAPPQDADRVDSVMAAYREQTRAEVPCDRTADPGEIVVCALRDADHDRVPFVTAIRPEDSSGARIDRLTRDYGRFDCGQGAFFHRCGSVGVSMTIDSAGNSSGIKPRELAP